MAAQRPRSPGLPSYAHGTFQLRRSNAEVYCVGRRLVNQTTPGVQGCGSLNVKAFVQRRSRHPPSCPEASSSRRGVHQCRLWCHDVWCVVQTSRERLGLGLVDDGRRSLDLRLKADWGLWPWAPGTSRSVTAPGPCLVASTSGPARYCTLVQADDGVQLQPGKGVA